MKIKLLQYFTALCLLLCVAVSARAQVYTYTTATTGAYASLDPNLTASPFAIVGTWGSNTPCGSGGISGITVGTAFTTFNPGNASSPAINVNISPNTGYSLTVTSISVSLRRSGTGPTKARLAYSVNGGTTWVDDGIDYAPNNAGCGSYSNYTWTLAAPLNVCSGMLKVRVYYFAPGAASGTCQTANLKVFGSVNPVLVPAVSISSDASVICDGTNVTFTAVPVNGGTSPVYSWTKNGSPVGTNSNTYADYSLTNTDVVTCSMASSAVCAAPASVGSNNVSVVVHQPVSFSFSDTICDAAVYNWAGQTLSSTGTYSSTFTSYLNCDSVVTLHLFARPAIAVSFADTICAGATYTWAGQSFAASGAYDHTFSSVHGCDSLVTLHLFVRPAVTNSFNDTICAAATYTWGGQTYTASGSYSHAFTAYTNCDSTVTLHLFVRPAITNAFADTICAAASYAWAGQTFTAGGAYSHTFTAATNCDSVVTLHLFVRPLNTFSFNDTICNEANYSWAGQIYTGSGVYNHTFTSVHNCDSLVTLHLFMRPAVTYTFADTICAAATYTWGGQSFTASGSYNHTFTAYTNCDSTVTLHLFVRPAVSNVVADTICAATSYTWGGQAYNTTGVYTHSFTTYTNCDSVVTLHLFVRPTIAVSFADTICAGTAYSWAAQSFAASGSYSHTFTSVHNCDSLVTLNLYVRPAITYSFADTICAAANYTWAGQTFTASGSYAHAFTSYTNCDSTVTLHLFVRPAVTHSFADTICAAASYTWAGQTFTAAGSYNHVFTGFTNCDSTVTLNLFVRPANTYSFNDTICAGGTYSWAGQSLAASGSYNHTFSSAINCDSIVTLHLFVRPLNTNAASFTICYGTTYTFGTQILAGSGTYTHTFQDVHGCDSVVTLSLTVSPLITSSFSKSICAGTSYSWGSQVYTATGSYNQTFTASGSCDSVVTLNLTVNLPIGDTVSKTICFGTSYTFGSQLLAASGDYTQVFAAANGCDSTVLLHLTVSPQIVHAANVSICYGQSYVFGTQVLSAAGNYTGVFTAASGCDSTVSLVLNVGAAPVSLVKDTASCGQLLFEGSLYTASTVLNDTFKTVSGCDSVYRTVHITIHDNNPLIKVIDTTGCNSVVFEGNVYSQSIALRDTLHSYLGCDSVVRDIHIMVNSAQVINRGEEICAGSSFTFNGTQYDKQGTYPVKFVNHSGCDSTIILNIKINPLPHVAIAAPDVVNHCLHDSVRLEASGANTYAWNSTLGTSEGDVMKAFLFDFTNTVTVVGRDANGCVDSAAVVINAETCCNLMMPNAFSPNGDGLNDYFKPESKGHPNEYALHIFSRWGETVFVSFNITDGWDGNIKGKPADIATYYYVVTGKCTNGEDIHMKGTLTLVR